MYKPCNTHNMSIDTSQKLCYTHFIIEKGEFGYVKNEKM